MHMKTVVALVVASGLFAPVIHAEDAIRPKVVHVQKESIAGSPSITNGRFCLTSKAREGKDRVVSSPCPTSAKPVARTTERFTSIVLPDGRCLAVHDGSVVATPCSINEPGQQWLIIGSASLAELKNAVNRRCLTVNSPDKGGFVTTEPCIGSAPQEWALPQ